MTQVSVTVPQILGFLDNGMSRKDIALELNLTDADVKRMFEHEELKGKQAKKQPGFVFVDTNDVNDASSEQDNDFATQEENHQEH